MTDAERSRAQAVRRALRFRLGRRHRPDLPPRKPARSRLCRPLQCRQVQPDQRPDRAQDAWRACPRRRARTRQINFFNLGGRLMLVDLPGYGFAKRSKTEAEEWQELIFAYLRGRARLRRVAAADRCPARRDGQRPAGDGAAGQGGRLLWPGADQDRRTQARRAQPKALAAAAAGSRQPHRRPG